MEDSLIFSVTWKSKSMTAQEVVAVMRDFLKGLERISPWSTPFDVSGLSRRLAHMPIAEDLSDFEEVVFKAMDDKEVRFFSEIEPETMRIRPDSRAAFGMSAEFSDYPCKNLKKSIVTVDISMGSYKSCYSSVAIRVPFYAPYTEENGAWAIPEQSEAVFEYLIDFFAPYSCAVYSSAFKSEVTEWEIDGVSLIGWRWYICSPKVIEALAGDPRVSNYRNGILIQIGDAPVVFKDSQARKELFPSAIEVRDKLRATGATNWIEE